MRYFALMILIAAGLSSFAQSKIEIVEGTKLDLGVINRGSVVDKKVTVKNSGNETLVLGNVEASCGCTGTVVSEKNIPPGKSGTILIRFNSANFHGPVLKYVTVNSNDPSNARTQIQFTANIIQEVSVNPAQFWFRNAEVGKKTISSVVVQNLGKEQLTISSYDSELSGLVMKLPEKPIEPGQSAEIVAEFTPKAPTTVLSDAVILKTSNKNQPQLYVYVYGSVKEFKF